MGGYYLSDTTIGEILIKLQSNSALIAIKDKTLSAINDNFNFNALGFTWTKFVLSIVNYKTSNVKTV